MKMKMKNLIFTVGLGLVMSVPAWAQVPAKRDTIKARVVEVEQEYTPITSSKNRVVMRHKKQTVMNSGKRNAYDTSISKSTFVTKGKMPSFRANQVGPNGTAMNSLRLGAGNNGNVLTIGTFSSQLNRRDQLDGFVNLVGENWNTRDYKTKVGMNYLHHDNDIDLYLGGQISNRVFNYIVNPMTIGGTNTRPNQQYSGSQWVIGAKSHDEGWDIGFNNQFRLSTFKEGHALLGGIRSAETRLQLKGSVFANIEEESQIQVNYDANNFQYKENQTNYSNINLNPFYQYKNDEWLIHLGATMDMSFNYGTFYRIAPDVLAEYRINNDFVLYSQVTGGKQINDYRTLLSINPYTSLSKRYEDSYEQLNTAVGVKGSPAIGLWLHAALGYKMITDDLLQSGYALYNAIAPTMQVDNTQRVYAKFEGSYDTPTYGNFHWAATLYKNHADHSYSQNMMEKITVKTGINAYLSNRLTMKMEYEYGVKDYQKNTKANDINTKDINNLTLGLAFQFLPNISIWGEGRNLFDCSYTRYTSHIEEGVNVLGGITIKF